MTPSGGRLIVTATAAACAYVVVALPRAIEPREPPWFLESAPAAAAEPAPIPPDPMLDRLIELILARGAFEAGGSEPPSATRERADRTRMLAASVERNLGAEPLEAVARDLVRRIEAAIVGDADADPALLGDFERQLARYGAVREGRRVAPRVVVRALAAARVAALLQMEPTRFMSDGEAEAYFAWAALHAGSDREELRELGLGGWRAHDAVRADEARAYHAYVSRRHDEAARLYQRVHEATGELAARNHSLAALVRAEIPGGLGTVDR